MRFSYQILSVCLATLTAGLGCSQPAHDVTATASRGTVPTRVSVQLVSATRSDISSSIEVVGSLVARRESILVAEVDGVVLEIGAAQPEALPPGLHGQQFSSASRIDSWRYSVGGSSRARRSKPRPRRTSSGSKKRGAGADVSLRRLSTPPWRAPENGPDGWWLREVASRLFRLPPLC